MEERTVNLAAWHFEGRDHGNSDLRVFDNDYDSISLTHLLQLLPFYKNLKYVFKTGISKQFINQMRWLNMLSNQFQVPILFISSSPATMESSHFICGVVYKNQLLFINPLGERLNKDCVDTLSSLVNKNEANVFRRIYISNDVIQVDPIGQSSCGPICVEIMRVLNNKSHEIPSLFSEWDKIPSLKAKRKNNLEYYPVSINEVCVPPELSGMNVGNAKLIMGKVRSHHYEELCSQPLTQLMAQSEHVDLDKQDKFIQAQLMNAPVQIVVFKLTFENLQISDLNEDEDYRRLQNLFKISTTREYRSKSEHTSSEREDDQKLGFTHKLSFTHTKYSGPGSLPQIRNESCEIDVPGDDSCLFWAAALSYLLPVHLDIKEYKERFIKMFGSDHYMNEVQKLLFEYNPYSNINLFFDHRLNSLIREDFRAKVINFMAGNKKIFLEYFANEKEFEGYLNKMQHSSSWGGELEVKALSLLLECNIYLDGMSAPQSYPQEFDRKLPRLHLTHANFRGNKAGEKNHYHYHLDMKSSSEYQERAKLKQYENTTIYSKDLDKIVLMLFTGILEDLKTYFETLQFTLPSAFIIYAHDSTDKSEPKAEGKVTEKLIKWLHHDLGLKNIVSDRSTLDTHEKTDFLFNQMRILPNLDRSVDFVILCGSELLGKYVNHARYGEFVDAIGTSLAGARHDRGLIHSDCVQHTSNFKRDKTFFHQVLTEIAFLRSRLISAGQTKNVIPILINGDADRSFPECIVPTHLHIEVTKWRKAVIFNEVQTYKDQGLHLGTFEILERLFIDHADVVQVIQTYKEKYNEGVKSISEGQNRQNVLTVLENYRKGKIKKRDSKTDETFEFVYKGLSRKIMFNQVPQKVKSGSGDGQDEFRFNNLDEQPPNDDFYGREDELDELFSGSNRLPGFGLINKKHPILIQVIAGINGMGKTQLAKEYAYRHKHEYKIVIWCNGDVGNIKRVFESLLVKLGVVFSKKSDLQHLTRKALSNNNNWLLILNDFLSFDLIKAYLPRSSSDTESRRHVIITSNRKGNWPQLPVLHLGAWHEEEAVGFVLNLLVKKKKITVDKDEVREFCSNLGNYPLAITLALTTIKPYHTLHDYNREYEDDPKQVIKEGDIKELDDYQMTVYKTIKQTLDFLDGSGIQIETRNKAKELLKYLSILASDSIPISLVQKWGEQNKISDKLLREILGNLEDLCLLESRSVERQAYFSINRMTQEVVFLTVPSVFLSLFISNNFSQVFQLSDTIFDVEYSYDQSVPRKLEGNLMLVPHIEFYSKRAGQYLAKHQMKSNEKDKLRYLRFKWLLKLGEFYYFELLDRPMALKYLTKAEEQYSLLISSVHCAPSNKERNFLFSTLRTIYIEENDFPAVERYETFAKQVEVYETKDAKVLEEECLRNMFDKARQCILKSEYTQGLQAIDEGLNICVIQKRKLKGENVNFSQEAMLHATKAIIYHHLGKFKKALMYHEMSVEMRKEIFKENPEHHHLYTPYFVKAQIAIDLGLYQDAVGYLNILRDYLNRTKHLPDKSMPLSYMKEMGHLHYCLGDYKKAEEELEKAEQYHKENYLSKEGGHPYIFYFFVPLYQGKVALAQGKYDKADEYFKIANQYIVKQRQSMRCEKKSVYEAELELFQSKLSSARENFEAAVSHLKQSREILRMNFGEDNHPRFIQLYHTIAELELLQGKKDNALMYLARTFKLLERYYAKRNRFHIEYIVYFRINIEICLVGNDVLQAQVYFNNIRDLESHNTFLATNHIERKQLRKVDASLKRLVRKPEPATKSLSSGFSQELIAQIIYIQGAARGTMTRLFLQSEWERVIDRAIFQFVSEKRFDIVATLTAFRQRDDLDGLIKAMSYLTDLDYTQDQWVSSLNKNPKQNSKVSTGVTEVRSQRSGSLTDTMREQVSAVTSYIGDAMSSLRLRENMQQLFQEISSSTQSDTQALSKNQEEDNGSQESPRKY